MLKLIVAIVLALIAFELLGVLLGAALGDRDY